MSDELTKLREALRFYADIDNWKAKLPGTSSDAVLDLGAKARTTLAEVGDTPPLKLTVAKAEDGDLMTIDEFRRDVAAGGLIDDDGFGLPAKVEGGVIYEDDSDIDGIMPSAIKAGLDAIPSWATHIMWYNR